MKKYILHRFLLWLALLSTVIFIPSLASIPAYGKEAPPSLYVNLQDFPLYLKRGFAPKYAVQPEVEDGSWLKKAPFSTVIISKSGLPGLPKRTFLSPFGQAEEEFTFVIPFALRGLNDLAQSVTPGLFLPGIGDNWEVYLNGVLVRSEMHLDGDSLRIQEHRSQRHVFFPLPRHHLREGENLLTFRIVGDPTDKTVGFQYSVPFYIGEYQSIERNSNETVAMLLIGGYLLIAVYHLALFAIRRKDIHNLYCGIFSALMGFYFLCRTHGIYHYISDTALVVRLEFFCIFMVLPALGAFVETLCQGKISLITKLYSAIFALLAVSQLILPRPYGSDALVAWQVMGIAALLYILINNIILAFIREVRAEKKQYTLRGAKVPGIPYFLAETYTGNLLLAITIVVTSAIVDILDSLFFHYQLNFTRYCFYFFVMTVTLLLARIYGKLNNALQAKSLFLANMSHEIRTPLNAIMGMTEQIARENPPETIREKTEKIQQAGNILISIINDILDFSRLEAGKIQIVNREYNFHTLVNEVTGIMGMEIADKNVAFKVAIDRAIPQTLMGDALRIRQILVNLLWNASKFTRQGEIVFRAERKEREKQLTIVFTVSDTGIGIKRENFGNIFTEFYRLDSRGRLNTEGTGLGLTICKNLCQLMGGEIGVQSEYGKGSTFTVTLPQQPGTGKTVPETARKASLLERGVALYGVRALIVDDLPINRQVIAGLLRPYCMELHTAANGQEALELAAAHTYDIVFMDHVMDDALDGVATTQGMRKLPAHAATPVVALTAHAMTGMREFFLEHGLQDYISKPIDPALLDDVLARWVPEEKHGKKPPEAQEHSASTHPPPTHSVPDAGNGMPLDMASAVKAELAVQRLNLLHHYRWHFARDFAVNSAYCAQFTTLLETLWEGLPEFPAELREKMATLTDAGRRGAVTKIQQDLPEFCAALSALLEKSTQNEQRVALPGKEESDLHGLLGNLKKALDTNDSGGAEALMTQLRSLPWPASLGTETRELYFFLYDAFMMNQTEQAAGALALWFKIFGHQAGNLWTKGNTGS